MSRIEMTIGGVPVFADSQHEAGSLLATYILITTRENEEKRMGYPEPILNLVVRTVGRDLWRERLAGEFHRAPQKTVLEWVLARLAAEPDNLLWLNVKCAIDERELELEAIGVPKLWRMK